MIPALAALVGVAIGIAGMVPIWLAARRRQRVLAADVSRMAHDLRGALSPALLIAEQLEAGKLPAGAQSGKILVTAIDRAAGIGRTLSERAKAVQRRRKAQ